MQILKQNLLVKIHKKIQYSILETQIHHIKHPSLIVATNLCFLYTDVGMDSIVSISSCCWKITKK